MGDIRIEQKEAERQDFLKEVAAEEQKIQWEEEQKEKLKEIEDRTRVIEEIVEEEKLIAQGVPIDRSQLEEDKVLSPSALQAKEGYIVDLKQLIDKSRKKIEKVNLKLEDQARRRRNQQREERARVYYEKAMRLFDDGKYDEARVLWEKAIRITEHVEMKDYVRESVHRSKRQEAGLRKEHDKQLKRIEIERGYSAKEVERLYQAGVSLFKQAKYLAAREDFEAVEEMFPDHKATRSYLMLIEQNIIKEQESLIRKKVQEKAENRKKEKALWRKEIEKQEKRRETELKTQAEEIYKLAVKHYKEKDWKKAKEKFKEVEWILPNYKKTVSYLKVVSKHVAADEKSDGRLDSFKAKVKDEKKGEEEEKAFLQKQKRVKDQGEAARKKEETDFVYNAAVSLYKSYQYDQALDKFKEVLKIDPEHKNAHKFVTKLKRDKEGLKQKQESAQNKEEAKKKIKQAKAFYQKAMLAYKQKEYKKAKEGFKLVEGAYPDYKATRKYLDLIKRKMMDETQELEILYSSAVSLYKARQYSNAKDKFNEVLAINGNHVNSHKYLMEIEKKEAKDRQKQMLADDKKAKEHSYKKAQKYYDGAVSLYKKGKYKHAQAAFQRTQEIHHGFKNALKYLTMIETKMAQEKKEPTTGALKSFQAVIKKEKIQKQKAKSEHIYQTALNLYKEEDYSAA
ncbi:hypothetical protein ACFL49_03170, partial [Candidatus Omnitrophota bacterium]